MSSKGDDMMTNAAAWSGIQTQLNDTVSSGGTVAVAIAIALAVLFFGVRLIRRIAGR